MVSDVFDLILLILSYEKLCDVSLFLLIRNRLLVHATTDPLSTIEAVLSSINNNLDFTVNNGVRQGLNYTGV